MTKIVQPSVWPLLWVAIILTGCGFHGQLCLFPDDCPTEAQQQAEYNRVHWSVTFDTPTLDGRNNRAELVDWALREHNGICVPIEEEHGPGAFYRCQAKVDELYHYYERKADLPYRSLSEDTVHPPLTPPPSMPMQTNCMPNIGGGGFNCTSY